MSVELMVASLVILACSALIILLLTSDRLPWLKAKNKGGENRYSKLLRKQRRTDP